MKKLFCVVGLTLAAFAQADKSTPENTVKSFLKERYPFEGMDIFVKMMEDADKIEDPFITDGYRKKKKDDAEKNKQFFRERKDFKVESTESTKEADGSVTIIVKDSYQAKDNRETRNSKFSLKKVGNDWLIFQSYNQCYSCKGTGSCGSCNGTGKYGDSDCLVCKGLKVCASCKGEKWLKEDYNDMDVDFVIPDAEYKGANDLSSSAKAAETYCHVILQQSISASNIFLKIFDDMEKIFSTYFSPEISKLVSTQVAKSKEKGKENFKNFKVKVISLKEVDATTAMAEISSPPALLMRSMKKSRKISLKKVGEKWLVDNVLQDCYSCEGTGKCRLCNGTGKSGDDKCFACNGSGVCSICKGSGVLDK